jgi:hypothetical protein
MIGGVFVTENAPLLNFIVKILRHQNFYSKLELVWASTVLLPNLLNTNLLEWVAKVQDIWITMV